LQEFSSNKKDNFLEREDDEKDIEILELKRLLGDLEVSRQDLVDQLEQNKSKATNLLMLKDI
jgi:hypothetical protein